eukprot:TRINITY_DN21069_c1_g1_i1.p1 TRINITY_DN21069_c1_g1~~TRINITY_DN21069_c1_g1_i1.p1  ORF type:complete len:550 (+),score=138.61 TRINITY_DN21069_c1_g1_i1:138-1787(+)
MLTAPAPLDFRLLPSAAPPLHRRPVACGYDAKRRPDIWSGRRLQRRSPPRWGAADESTPKMSCFRATASVALAAVTSAQLAARTFATRKENFLQKPDKSPKGSFDTRVVDICDFINSREDLFTTSSCSGRGFLWRGRHHQDDVVPALDSSGDAAAAANMSEATEGGSGFLRFRISHDPIDDAGTLDPAGAPGQGPIWLSAQPFILHVCCRDMQAATMLCAAAQKSFERVKLYAWKQGRWMVEIEGDQHLELPLTTQDGQRSAFAGQEIWLRDLVNTKLQENWSCMEGFLDAMQDTFRQAPEDLRRCPAAAGCASEEAVRQLAARLTAPKRQGYVAVEPLPLPTDASEFELAKLAAAKLDAEDETRSAVDGFRTLCDAIGQRSDMYVAGGCPCRSYHCWADDAAAAAPFGIASARMNYAELQDDAYFKVADDAAAASCEGGDNTRYLRLEPYQMYVCCRDMPTARALVLAAGTLGKKPGLIAWQQAEAPCLVKIVGRDCLQLPLTTPSSGSGPYDGHEAWLLQLVNQGLREDLNKVEKLADAVRGMTAQA